MPFRKKFVPSYCNWKQNKFNNQKYKVMKAIELTKNEREILEAIVANAKKVGDSGVEFILQDVTR